MHAPGENKESIKRYSESRDSTRPLVLRKASLGWPPGREQNAMQERALCSSRPSSSWIMCAKSHSFNRTRLHYANCPVPCFFYSTMNYRLISSVCMCGTELFFFSDRLVFHNMYHNLNIWILSDYFSFFY